MRVAASAAGGVAAAAFAALYAVPALAQAAATTPGTAASAQAEGAQPAGQPDGATGRRSYEAAYFAQFSPATALQVIERVPGFSIEEVDPTVRGFAQAAGNVVINGQRPSSKSDTTRTILARIPASRVLRVEVGPGDRFAAEYTGKSQVANLILTTTGGAATTVEATLRRSFTGHLLPAGSVSSLRRAGKSTFNDSLTIDNEQTTEEGYDRVVALPARTLVEYRRKTNRSAEPNVAAAASWDHDDGPNRTAHVNVRAFVDRFRLDQTNDVSPVGGTVRDDRLAQRVKYDSVELGGDVTRPFAGGGLKLLGLATRVYRRSRDTSFNRVRSQVIGGARQNLNNTNAETLARLVWSRSNWGGWNVELGGEGVVNRLDSRVDLFAVAAGGGTQRIDLPIDNAVVREVRGEGFVNVGRALSPRLRADAGLTYEASRLTVSGDAGAQRTLTFLKPKLALDWRPFGRWHAQLSIQRTVAQLQFEDFISSAELSNDRVNGGNAQLLPQRAWETLATLERPILGEGLARLELGYNRVQLVQDRVPTPEGFDAPGNLGDGRVAIVRGRVEAPLKTLGFSGGRLIVSGSYLDSAVRDPYTLRDRPFSGNALFFGEATLRQDLKHFAWGLTAQARTDTVYYRRDELDRNINSLPYLTGFVEWRPNAASVLTLSIDNLGDSPGARRRTFFRPDRRTLAPSIEEYRSRNRHVFPSLTYKRTLG